MKLPPAKQAELQRALDDALADHALLSAPPGVEPLIGTPPLPLAHIADEELHVVRHKDSGCVQFVFPPPGQPLLKEGWDWIVQATLRAGEHMTQAMVEKIEAHHKPERLLALSRGFQQSARPADLAAARGKRVLLLVHGLFSSTEGGFGALDLQPLIERYEGRVFGWDHWTIAKTPQQNALDLLQHMPPAADWALDVVCHSRGGLVLRSLLADGADGDAVLAQIGRERAGRIARVGKVTFVAAANQGSKLASPDDILEFLNVAAMLASFSAGMGLDVVIGLARMVVSLGYDRPAVQALTDDSALIATLNRAGGLIAPERSWYARANFDYGSSALERTGALLSRALIEADNDLVVPYAGVLLPGAAPAADHILNFGTAEHKQNQVWHTEFFRQAATRDFLLQILTNRD
ncbi:esterase/lipase family protein [Duganella callida]|uniref:DUF7379 domain-containing protein n=1 Tax=Duganella callida TaxID=2561932 RepID=A0A4Y9T0M0_9BURK|nr:hypothetical protein [Duganella callida]TFW31391.1 hypothetical protein E4L98_00425 [Duganella callida]